MRDKWWPLVAICLGTFMLLVDVTIVSVALPTMAVELHASFSSLQWVLDGYAVALHQWLQHRGTAVPCRLQPRFRGVLPVCRRSGAAGRIGINGG